MPEADVADQDLQHYLHVLRRRKWTIASATLVVVASALVASYLQTPVYAAKAEMLIQPRVSETLFNPGTGQVANTAGGVQTEIQLLESQPVRDAVIKKIGGAPPITVSQVGQTNVVELTARSTIPKQAAAVANAYVSAYIDFRRKQTVDDLLGAGQGIQAKIGDLQRQVNAIDAQVAQPPASQRSAATDNVVAEKTALLDQQASLKQLLDRLELDASLNTGGAQLVTPASVPTTPFKPTPRRNGVVALALGLVFGAGLAFLFEYLDDSIKNKDDLERSAHGLPVIGLIPVVSGWKDEGEPRVVSLTEPTSPVSEAYRTLRTSIQFMGLERPLRTLQVTSPSATEGKTTTIANLAVALARAGQRVIVCCCDLRRPRLHEFFGVGNAVGFTSALVGDIPLSMALQAVPGVERLAVLASGPLPPNPSELLSTKRTVEVLTALQAEADIVLIDSPPVLPVTDAAVLAGRVDATIVVATAGVTGRKELGRAVEILRQVDAPLVGTVLNGLNAEAGYGYGYGYAYRQYYGKDDAASGRREATRKR